MTKIKRLMVVILSLMLLVVSSSVCNATNINQYITSDYLDGVWIYEYGNQSCREYVFNNDRFSEASLLGGEVYMYREGTYTINGNTIIVNFDCVYVNLDDKIISTQYVLDFLTVILPNNGLKLEQTELKRSDFEKITGLCKEYFTSSTDINDYEYEYDSNKQYELNGAGLENFNFVNTFTSNTFYDVKENDWYYQSVKEAYQIGLMTGNGVSTFNPEGNITIAEAIAISCRLHNTYWATNDVFQQEDPWYKCYVNYAIENDIIGQNQFSDYTQSATRAQFASIVANAFPENALRSINTIRSDSIPDVPSAASYADAVYRLYGAGILTGSDKYGTFNPENTISRGEVSAIITRMAIISNRKTFTLVEKPKVISSLSDALSAPFDTSQQISTVLSGYYADGTYSGGNFRFIFNSADGVTLSWGAQNTTDKTIKYLTFTVNYYNAVGDPAYDEITNKQSTTIRLTGPIEANKSFVFRKLIGYGSDIYYGIITDVSIEYMDGAKISGNYGYTTWHDIRTTGSPKEVFTTN